MTTYDPEKQYDAQVSRPVKVGSFKYLPRDQITASGELLNRIVEEEGADAIRSAVAR